MPKITLYHYYRSSCSWRVRWSLHYKGIAFEAIAINLLKNEQNTDSYLNLNPMAYVPSLTIDGETFSDSIAILEWLEEVCPHPALLPQDPRSRMRVRQLYQLIASGTQPLANLSAQRFYAEDQPSQREYARHWIKKGFSAYETMLTQTRGSFSFGESLTLADICLIPQCYNAIRFGLDLDQFPQINDIYNRCIKLDHYQKSIPDKYL